MKTSASLWSLPLSGSPRPRPPRDPRSGPPRTPDPGLPGPPSGTLKIDPKMGVPGDPKIGQKWGSRGTQKSAKNGGPRDPPNPGSGRGPPRGAPGRAGGPGRPDPDFRPRAPRAKNGHFWPFSVRTGKWPFLAIFPILFLLVGGQVAKMGPFSGSGAGGPILAARRRDRKKCTFRWVFNNSPSRDRFRTPGFWDKIHGGRVSGPAGRLLTLSTCRGLRRPLEGGPHLGAPRVQMWGVPPLLC